MRGRMQQKQYYLLEVSTKPVVLGSSDTLQVCHLVMRRTPHMRRNVSPNVSFIYTDYNTCHSLERNSQPQKAKANGC